MKVVYIAGPFRAPTAWGIAENVRAAERIGLDGTLELLRRCDAAVFIPGWPKSSGSRGEFKEAGRLGFPRLDLELVAFESDSVKSYRALIAQAVHAWVRAEVIK